VEVQVQREGNQRLWPMEQRDLGCRSGYVREVVLLLDGVPVVWARSSTSHAALKGPWKAMARLGNRPLAELLFQGQGVRRAPLQSHRLARHGPADTRVRNQWERLAPDATTPRWARSSVFWHRGQALRVLEAFAPAMVALAAGGRR
jgi:chorismate--pyruvate lyase